MSICVAKT